MTLADLPAVQALSREEQLELVADLWDHIAARPDDDLLPVSPDLEPMETVTGIGGIFFKARDPARMAAWYRDQLGVRNEEGHADFPWRLHDRPGEVGHTAWALFPADTDYLGPGPTGFMVNYRVGNLDRMLEQLRAAAVTVDRVEDNDYGRFAWLSDPEGNRVELWQPTT